MTLFELLGLIAVGGGVGLSYGLSVPHGTIPWFSLMAAAVIGAFAYVGFGRLTGRFASERALATMYVVTFIGTLAATVLGAWLVRAIVGTITR